MPTKRLFRCEKHTKNQLPLPELATVHSKVKKLKKISSILNENSNTYELVAQVLGRADNDTGANGMSVEQVSMHRLYEF